MKKIVFIMLLCALFLVGCGANSEPVQTSAPAEPQTQIGNPWKSYDSMVEAQQICGFDFPMPETVGEYVAESFRVMNAQLLEVIYRAGEDKVIVRMAAGEGQDISGVYTDPVHTETIVNNGASVTVKQLDAGFLHLISMGGYSYSLYAPNGYRTDADLDFISNICKP